MQIDAEKSEVGIEAEGIPISVSASGQIVRAPRIDATTAFTTVSALSGQTVVLSGLLTNRESDIHRRVPLLARHSADRRLVPLRQRGQATHANC